MKRIFIAFLLLFNCFMHVYADNKAFIYIAAPSGLSLREGPNRDSKKIMLIPYGTKITNYNHTDFSEKIDGYYGNWVRIAWNGKDGYIFDGYTLPIQPPTTEDRDIMDYLAKLWGKPVFLDSFPNSYIDDNSGKYEMNYRYMYKSGEILLIPALMEASENTLLNLDLSIYDAYLWMYLIGKYIYTSPKNPTFNYYFPLYGLIECPEKNIKNDSLEIIIKNDGLEEIEINKRTDHHQYIRLLWHGGRVTIIWGSDIF